VDQLSLVVEEAAAAASLTRLAAADVITRPLRWGLLRDARRGDSRSSAWASTAEEIAGCPWCMSMYTSLAVIALRWVPGGALIRRALALRWLAAIATLRLDGSGRDWPPELTFTRGRAPGTFVPSDGTVAELRDEAVFWRRNQPSTLSQIARRDMIDASLTELDKRMAMSAGT
jgi:hypothetical protein